MSHTHDGLSAHSHSFNAAEHGHSHETLYGPGSFTEREMPIIEGRDWTERAFTVGIGGYADPRAGVSSHRLGTKSADHPNNSPVGSGKTALMLQLCLALRDKYSIAAVTNDIFTRYIPSP